MYDPFDPDPIFQIDANLGYPAAVMVRYYLFGDEDLLDCSRRMRWYKHLMSQLRTRL
jgi:hypothetical protein